MWLCDVYQTTTASCRTLISTPSPPHTPKMTWSGPLLTMTTVTTQTCAPECDDAKGRGCKHDDKEGGDGYNVPIPWKGFFCLIYYIQLLTPSSSQSCPVPQLKYEKCTSKVHFSPQDASTSSRTQQHKERRWVRDKSARGTQQQGWGWAHCAHPHKRFILFLLKCHLSYWHPSSHLQPFPRLTPKATPDLPAAEWHILHFQLVEKPAVVGMFFMFRASQPFPPAPTRHRHINMTPGCNDTKGRDKNASTWGWGWAVVPFLTKGFFLLLHCILILTFILSSPAVPPPPPSLNTSTEYTVGHVFMFGWFSSTSTPPSSQTWKCVHMATFHPPEHQCA